MPIVDRLPDDRQDYFYVESTVTWKTPAGALLGTMNFFYNGSRDYKCATVIRPCTPGPGYIYLG